ncbi:hypothetical protein C8R46DRAFT_1085272 [Mycena filopes]|nr:hypothetical protein C8R46DRAFT_1085272 [Mycena filopes]
MRPSSFLAKFKRQFVRAPLIPRKGDASYKTQTKIDEYQRYSRYPTMSSSKHWNLLEKLHRLKFARTPTSSASEVLSAAKNANASESMPVLDGLTLALEIAAQVTKIVGAAPFLEPARNLLTEIIKSYQEVKSTNEKRDALAIHIADITGDICAPLLRVEATEDQSELIQRLKSDLQKYKTLIEKASVFVLKYNGRRKITIWFGRNQLAGEIDNLNQELDSFGARLRTNRLIDLAINHDTTTKTLDDIHRIAVHEELEKWLESPPPMKQKQHDTEALRMEGTGSWLLEDAAFIEWEDNPGVLWIQGPSGAGKSVIASTVIKCLSHADDKLSPAHPVAFFYFDFTNKDQQSLEIALRRLILQLSAYSPQPYKALEDHYKLSKGQQLPSYCDLVKILKRLLRELGRTYLVLDALDECADSDFGPIIDFISTLRTWARVEPPLHVCITSQPRKIFAEGFKDISRIVLGYDTARADISLFVHRKITTNPKLKIWRHRADQVVDRVTQKSNGMFRLASCLLIELSHCNYEDELEETLENLPEDLFAVYDRFLQKNQRQWPYVAATLHWIMFAAKPISLVKLADAIAFDYSDPVQFIYKPERQNRNVQAIFEWLEGLVVRSSTSKRAVTLAHVSVRDYLLSGPKFGSDFSESHSHTFIARTCLSYLLYLADHASAHTPYPLGAYATTRWSYHLLRSHDRRQLSDLALKFLQGGTGEWPKHSPLSFCCTIGYLEGVQSLLASGAEPDYAYPLVTASYHGHLEIVKLLLENGAHVNHLGSKKHGGALGSASYAGQVETVRFLLENGAAVDLPGGKFGSALGAASFAGNISVAQILLENGANSNLVGYHGPPLRIACLHGDVELAHLLLEKGADVDATGGRLVSALGTAAFVGNIDVVRLLLDRGADINLAGGQYGSALGCAASGGNADIVRLLLDKGVDVEAHGSRALKAAKQMKKKKLEHQNEIIALLKEKGAIEVDEERGV